VAAILVVENEMKERLATIFNKYKELILLLSVLILGFSLRVYHLGQVPNGLAWDEAAIAYNGYAILTTRRDEWLNRLPVSFRSFGDYKAPLAIYQSGFFTTIFGMNSFAVRLPFVLHGLLAILAIYLLFKELFFHHEKKQFLALAAAFLLSISPWHLHYSRLAFESGIALNLMLWGIYFFYRYLRLGKSINLFISAFFSILTLYAYHSSKITVPVLMFVLMMLNWSKLKNNLKTLFFVALFSLFLSFPLLKDAFFAEGLTRASSIIFFQNNPLSETMGVFSKNVLSYFSLDFLLFGQNNGNFRHGDGRFGILDPISIFLMTTYLLSSKKKSLFVVSIFMILTGLLPAMISSGESSSNRSILAILGAILLIVLSWEYFHTAIKNKFKINISYFIVGLYCVFTVFYQYHYYTEYPNKSANDFMDGYLQTFSYLRSLDLNKVDQIVFTSDYQHPYIYALFAFEVSPIAYQGGILNLFFFADSINNSDLHKSKTIVVASKFDQITEREPDLVINGGDGQGRFFIYLPL